MSWTGIALFVQLFFGIVIGLYFWNLLKNQRTQKVTIDKESKKKWNSRAKCAPSVYQNLYQKRCGRKAFRTLSARKTN